MMSNSTKPKRPEPVTRHGLLSLARSSLHNFSRRRGQFSRPIHSLQVRVDRLARAPGLFDQGPKFHELLPAANLRQQFFLIICYAYILENRLLLAEHLCPSPTQEVHGNLHIDFFKPPDPEEEHSSILVCITIFIQGAIFGAVLLYWLRRCSDTLPASIKLTSRQCLDTAFRLYGYPF